jgi:GTPase SAR1 family protein
VKIDGIQVSRGYGARIVGVYGVGGIGKTTSCKVLCNDYFEEFEGKVCHIDLEEADRNKSRTFEELL